MKKNYVKPSVAVCYAGTQTALLASSFIPIGGETDHFDTKDSGDWDIWGDTENVYN